MIGHVVANAPALVAAARGVPEPLATISNKSPEGLGPGRHASGDRHYLLLAVETVLLDRLHVRKRGRFEHRVLRVLDDLVVELLQRLCAEDAEQ